MIEGNQSSMKKLVDDSGWRWSEEKMILCVFFLRAFCAAHTMKIVEFFGAASRRLRT